MKNDITYADRITSSARTLFRRVVRILKGCGITDLQLKQIFQDVMSESGAIHHPHVTSSTARQLITCSDLVLRWRRDANFLNSEGLPEILSLDGSSPTFVDLVRVVAPNDDPSALLDLMKELGAVRMRRGKSVELISESVVACSGRDGWTIASEPVLEHICGFLGSVEYNLFDKLSRSKGRFERACYASVPENLVPILEKLVSSRGQDFVDVVDEWLARRAIRPTNDPRSVLVGAGAYVFVRQNIV